MSSEDRKIYLLIPVAEASSRGLPVASRPIRIRFSFFRTDRRSELCLRPKLRATFGILVLALSLGATLAAQRAPRVSGVAPSAGKANESVNLTGENLDRGYVSAVFLSDNKTENQAKIIEQTAEKIVFKVPRIKPGSYNISIQVGSSTATFPFTFEVQR